MAPSQQSWIRCKVSQNLTHAIVAGGVRSLSHYTTNTINSDLFLGSDSMWFTFLKKRIEIHGTSQQAKHPHVCLEMLKMWSASPGPLMLICQPCLQSRHFGGCCLKWVRMLWNMKNESKAIWWILVCKIFGIQIVHYLAPDTIITRWKCEDYILAIPTSLQ